METRGTISTHIHPHTREYNEYLKPMMLKMGAGGVRAEERTLHAVTIHDYIADMDANGIQKSVLLPVDMRTRGLGYLPNDYIADLVKQYPDRLIGFACVDPHMGAEAVRELDRSVRTLGLKGLGEFDGTKQEFCPSDKNVYPVYEKCRELNIPVNFHAGNSPGFPIQYGDPVYIDRVACDFPELRICISHFGWPWLDVAAAIAWTKPNVYLDLNAIRLKYLPPLIINYINTVLQDKVMFSHDYTAMDTKKVVKEFEELPLRDEVKRKIRVENPRRWLGM